MNAVQRGKFPKGLCINVGVPEGAKWICNGMT